MIYFVYLEYLITKHLIYKTIKEGQEFKISCEIKKILYNFQNINE